MTGAPSSWELPGTALRPRPARAAGALAAPGSKSVTNRLLVLAALASGDSTLRDPLDSDDSRAMRAVVGGLGAQVRQDGAAWTVAGTGGDLRPGARELSAELSGTTMRFGAALAALSPAPVTLTGLPPLLRRPVGPLADALRALGARVEDHDGFPPVRAGGGLDGGAVTVEVGGSSQYASALLLVAPYARTDVTLELRGQAALSYVDLTAAAMREWGAVVERDGTRWRVEAGRTYQARDAVVEYDASAAAHLFTLAAATGGHVTVTNAEPATLQADAGFPVLLAAMGCGVHLEEEGRTISVSGPARLTGLGEVDLGAMPDQLPNAAVLAALADGETALRNVAVVRGHETDRIAALARELGKLGVAVEELPDGLRVRGGVPARTGEVRLATYDDHRLAMAFAALAARVGGVVIEEPWCVRKTYPRFWSDLRRLGVEAEAA